MHYGVQVATETFGTCMHYPCCAAVCKVREPEVVGDDASGATYYAFWDPFQDHAIVPEAGSIISCTNFCQLYAHQTCVGFVLTEPTRVVADPITGIEDDVGESVVTCIPLFKNSGVVVGPKYGCTFTDEVCERAVRVFSPEEGDRLFHIDGGEGCYAATNVMDTGAQLPRG